MEQAVASPSKVWQLILAIILTAVRFKSDQTNLEKYGLRLRGGEDLVSYGSCRAAGAVSYFQYTYFLLIAMVRSSV